LAQHEYTIGSFKKTFKHYEYETMMINIDKMLAEVLFLIFCYGQFKNTGIHSRVPKSFNFGINLLHNI